jgi:hypothetical protein
MGEIYEPAHGAVVSVKTELLNVPLRLDASDPANAAVDALRALAVKQADEYIAWAGEGWAKLDRRVLHMVEDYTWRELAEWCEEAGQALRALEALAPFIDDEDDDGESGLDPESSPPPLSMLSPRSTNG